MSPWLQRAVLAGVLGSLITCLSPSAVSAAEVVTLGAGRLQDARALAVDPVGDVYVADRAGRVVRFTRDGDVVTSWAVPTASAVRLTRAGHVLVGYGDHSAPGVATFERDGTPLASFSTPAPITAVAEDPATSRLYTTAGGVLTKRAPDGTPLWEAQLASRGFLGGVAVDAAGHVFVANDEANRIDELTADGQVVGAAGTPGSGDGQLQQPAGLVFDRLGDLQIADAYNFRVQRMRGGRQAAGAYGSRDLWGWIRDVGVTDDGFLFVPDGGRVLRVDAAKPEVRLNAPEQVDAGTPLTADASGTAAPLADVVHYAWSLDGRALTDGPSPRLTTSIDVVGDHVLTVTATSAFGRSSSASRTVAVRTPSPFGPVGVSIDAGARFTNNPDVVVRVRWPRFATGLWIANDGGFADALHLPVAAEVPWRLDSTGPERLPKTIYVRFEGGTAGAETYQDDIVLDQTPPSLLPVTVTPATSGSRVAAANTGAVKLRVRATDKTSGVRYLQVTPRKSAPGKLRDYRAKPTVRVTRKHLFVRVIDGAGNASRWRTVSLRRRVEVKCFVRGRGTSTRCARRPPRKPRG